MSDFWPWVLLAVAGVTVLYVPLAWVFPGLLRPLFRLIAHLVYRFHVYHADRVPASGPVLIVCNHVTYLDWLLLWAACPRPVTFVLWAGFYKNPLLRLFLSFSRHRTIAIASGRSKPHATLQALDRVVQALDAGRAVLVFPEGTLTRNGQMLPFGRGIERVLREAKDPVPVVPAYLDNLWGSVFSWERGKVFWKWPKDFRRRVAVWFGEPLPPTVTAAEARLAVVECGADVAIRQSEYLLPCNRWAVRQAARFRNLFRPAMVDVATGTERKLTWARVLVGAWCLRRWLASRVGPEPNVGVWLPTGLGSALANLALSWLHRTVVNLNYTAGPDPVLSAVRQAGITTVVTSKRFLTRAPMELPDDVGRLYVEDALAAVPGWERLLKFLAVVVSPGWFLDRVLLGLRTRLDDVVTILFSSGSTGEPKGVVLTYRNVTGNCDGFVRGVELRPGDRMLATLPFFHTFGYTVCLWAPAVVGMEAVFYPDPRQAQEVGDLCKKYGCTILLGTATFLRFYLRRSAPDAFGSLRLLICGAEKLPVKLAKEFEAKFAILPLEGYGCTELSPVVSTNLYDPPPLAGVKQVANKFGTVGQPIPGVAVRAFDLETLAPLPPGAEGLLGAKGPNVMLGYLHQPEKTKEVLRDGWYVSGDVGVVEADGFVRITGRVSRFAKVAGEMVPLERLDEEMHDVLGAGGERVLAVAAVPDERRGERVVVLHLPGVRDDLEDVFRQLRERGLPNLWVPDLRDCYAVDEFPVLGNGKLDLRAVGQLAKRVAGAA